MRREDGRGHRWIDEFDRDLHLLEDEGLLGRNCSYRDDSGGSGEQNFCQSGPGPPDVQGFSRYLEGTIAPRPDEHPGPVSPEYSSYFF